MKRREHLSAFGHSLMGRIARASEKKQTLDVAYA